MYFINQSWCSTIPGAPSKARRTNEKKELLFFNFSWWLQGCLTYYISIEVPKIERLWWWFLRRYKTPRCLMNVKIVKEIIFLWLIQQLYLFRHQMYLPINWKKSAKVHLYQQMNLKCMLSRKILYFATQDRANKSNKH